MEDRTTQKLHPFQPETCKIKIQSSWFQNSSTEDHNPHAELEGLPYIIYTHPKNLLAMLASVQEVSNGATTLH